MITQERPNTVQTSGIKDTVSFGIKQDGLAHIFSVLRNQLYSDKILAVVREYSTNAVDAHVEAGKPDEPIRVDLPTRFSPTLKIRDYGSGLTDEDIQDIYAFYGESTKRKSNAFVGQLGLGSKSAFAYGDNFVITSFVDGVKNTYNAFIDVSQIGQIAKLASEPTNEPNGVEIAIAVKDYDISTFHQKAHALFRYFRIRPNVKGADFKYEAYTPIMKGKDWAIYGQGVVPTVAIMGNIGYPIDNHWSTDESISNTLGAGLEVTFNIGDLEISASREKLQYTDRTKKAIKDKLNQIVKEVSDELNTRFQNCTTLFDAHKLYGSVMDYGSNLYCLRGMVKNSLKFKGKQIHSNNIQLNQPNNGTWSLRCYESTWRGNGIKSWEFGTIDCNDKTVLIENDLKVQGGINNRIWNLVKVDNKKVYVLHFKEDKDKQEFFTTTGLEDVNFIKLSSLPKISLANAQGAAPKNSKHTSKEFSFDTTFKGGRYHRKYSDYWTTETVDLANDSGIYVLIDNFRFENQRGIYVYPTELTKIVEDLKVFGITLPKIFGFKIAKKDAVLANPNMVKLWDYISKELTDYFVKNKVAQKISNRFEYDQNYGHRWLSFLLQNGKKVKPKTKFAEIAKTFDYMRHEADKTILDTAAAWKDYFTATDKPEHDLGALAVELENTYPMFKYIRYWDEIGMSKDVATYVNSIDG